MQGAEAVRLIINGHTISANQVQLPPLGLRLGQANADIHSKLYKTAVETVMAELQAIGQSDELIQRVARELFADPVMKMGSVRSLQN